MVTLLLAFRQMISSDGQTCNHFLILCAGLQLHMLTKSIITVYVTKRPYYFIEVWSSLFSGLQFVQPQKCYLCGGLEGPPNGKFWGGLFIQYFKIVFLLSDFKDTVQTPLHR